MKKVLILSMASALILNLSGCAHPTSKENVGIATGATLGAISGGALMAAGADTVPFMHVPLLPGIIVGGLIGGLLGGVIGHQMDKQDHEYMSRAITTTPMNETASWTNTKTKTTYHVTPTKDYKTANNEYCREYQTTVDIGQETKKVYGAACQKTDGSWHVVK